MSFGFDHGPRNRGGENFLEQLSLLQIFLRWRRLFVPVVMIVIAGAAPNFGGLCVDERNDGVVGYATTLDAVIVNDVA